MRGDERDLRILRALEETATKPAGYTLLEELAAAVGQSVSAVRYRLHKMRRLRWVVFEDGIWRSRVDPKQLELAMSDAELAR